MKFTIDYKSPDSTIALFVISGALERGFDLEKTDTLPNAISDALKKSKVMVVIFDLSELHTWDTEGIFRITQAVIDINTANPKRAGIIAPKNPLLYRQAKSKVAQIGTPTIPWKSDYDSLIAELES